MPDPNPTIIAMLEYDGGLACESDTGRGSGEDDRAGFEVVAWERKAMVWRTLKIWPLFGW